MQDRPPNPVRSSAWNYGGVNWKLSRSKIDLYFECPRCFYLDNVLGIKRPSFPPFTLNNAVDTLCKKEFDIHRVAGTAHPIMQAHEPGAVPFAHPDLESWRDNFTGIQVTHSETGLLVSGAVDDIWQRPDGTLLVIDYKATAKPGTITTLADSAWEQQYARQLSVYRWLLLRHGFEVSSTAYLYYANANVDAEGFYGALQFETTLVPVETDVSWIEDVLLQIRACLDAPHYPERGEFCAYCPYREAAGKSLQKLYFNGEQK